MRALTRLILLGATLTLAACASEPSTPPSPQPPTIPASPPKVSSPQDACGAAEAQRYVGRSRTEIPVPVLPELQRVACTTCPVTMDFNPRRLNFFYDAATGIVKEVKCG